MVDVVEPLLVPFQTYCDLLGIGSTKGYELIQGGEIESVYEGGRRRVFTNSIKAYVEKLHSLAHNGAKRQVKCVIQKGDPRPRKGERRVSLRDDAA